MAAAPVIGGRYRVTKITFVGGEPTLHPGLAELVRAAKQAGFTTCVVTNGYRLSRDADLRRELVPDLDWLAVSLDGPDEATNLAVGRGTRDALKTGEGDALRRVIETVSAIRALKPDIRVKVNTVVNAINVDTSMLNVISALRPDRWKVLQVTLLKGENDAAYAELAVTAEQFDAFIARHQTLPAGITVVPEPEGLVQGSYLMVDPEGRLFGNLSGRKIRGPSLLTASLDEAARVTGWQGETLEARGGSYDWGQSYASEQPPIHVAIEGLDGCGKSTITRALSRRLDAILVTNPPQSLRSEREAADRLPEPEKRAWYRHANFVAQSEAEAALASGRNVVFDRSFASTAVFAAATAGRVASRPDWPKALGRPDLIVLLSVDEAERCRRIGTRDRFTDEESRLRDDDAFRSRVLQGYLALGAVEVDANPSPEAVIDLILSLIRNHRFDV